MYDIIYKFSVRKTIYHNNKLSMTFSVWKLKTFSPYQVILYIIVKRKCGRKGKKKLFLWFLFLFQKISNARIISNAHTLYAYRFFFVFSHSSAFLFFRVHSYKKGKERKKNTKSVRIYFEKHVHFSNKKGQWTFMIHLYFYFTSFFFVFSGTSCLLKID